MKIGFLAAAFAAFAVFTAIGGGFSAPGHAQGAAQAVPSWSILAEESKLEFEGVQMGAPFQGRFNAFDGKIDFDPANLAASKASIVIQTGSAEAGSADRDKYLKMADWFNVDAFPEARFVTTGFEKGLDVNHFVAKGNLTIRDVTLPVTIPFALVFSKSDSGDDLVTMTGDGSINRLDFGVGQGQWADTKSVANPVKLRITVKARKIVSGAGSSPL